MVVVGLDLLWLNQHLREMRMTRGQLLVSADLLVTDREGNALARYPRASADLGRKVLPSVLPLIHQPVPGVANVPGYDGREYVAAYIPTTLPPEGLAIIATVYPPDMTADIDNATQREAILAVVSTLLALVLTIVAVRRRIVRPIERLTQAAQRWRIGDLMARAEVRETRSELGILATSFNAMAGALHERAMERTHQAELLEAQVVERTQALLEANNRLQTEVAEREKTEAALHQAQKLQVVGQLAGGIAHDFNNLLATILGNLELLQRQVDRDGATDRARLQTLIERATGAVQRGAQLTSQLLTFSRRQRLAPRATNVNHLIADFVGLASSALGRRTGIVTQLAPDLWPALVDPGQLDAALLNLCLNARDAMAMVARLSSSPPTRMSPPRAMTATISRLVPTCELTLSIPVQE
jgi:signal transduction histidine kinase